MLKRYVLTGAPGAGKPAVGLALARLGYPLVPEAATDVIAVEQARGVDEPWDSDDFVDKIVLLQRQRQAQVPAGEMAVQIFDRSPLCTLALARYLQRPVTQLLVQEVARVVEEQVYEPDVFLIRPLGFVTATPARRISYQDSLHFAAVHEAAYREHDFRLIDVPADEVDKRAAAIARHLHSSGR